MSIKKIVTTIATFVIVVLIWLFASKNANPLFIPSPIKVWNDFVQLLSDG